jgi:hypothetical protein
MQIEGNIVIGKSICLAAACVIAQFFCWPSHEVKAHETDESGRLRSYLRQGYTNGISFLDDCRLTAESESWRSPNWLEYVGSSNKAELTQIESEYIKKQERERFSRTSRSDYYDELYPDGAKTLHVFDGNYYLYYHNAKDTEADRGRAALVAASTGFGAESQTYGPLFFLREIVLDEFLQSSDTAIEPQLEQIGGVSCYKIHGPYEINRVVYNLTCWLCPERSFMPVRYELREQDGGMRREAEVTDFMKLANGGWFPKHVVVKGYWSAANIKEPAEEGPKGRWYIAKDTCNIKKIKLNPDINEAKVFNTAPESLPGGTLLQDQVAGLEYVIPEGPISRATIRRIIEKALEKLGPNTPAAKPKTAPGPQKKTPSETATPLLSNKGFTANEGLAATEQATNRASARKWALAAICALAIVILAALVLRRWSRTKAKTQ